MRVAYLDCFAGIAGDMCVAALLDAGVPWEELRSTLASLPVQGFEISRSATRRASIHALRFDVRLTQPDAGHRGLHEIRSILNAARLPPAVLQRALQVFERLAESEARAHAIPIDAVHFHEVGAIDCIVDIVAACWGFERLGVGRILCSPPPLGTGFVRCAHGLMPVPTPGALGALVGRDVVLGGAAMEMTTPTGAAILGALAETVVGPLPLRVEAIGHGAGARDLGEQPNFLRVIVGTLSAAYAQDEVLELATNLDQVSPEVVAYTLERALEAGALDVWVVPAQMKKSRAGVVLHVLAHPSERQALEELIFRETRSLGIRRYSAQRSKLERQVAEVRLDGTSIRVKARQLPDGTWRHQPEFEDVRQLAEASGAPLWDLWERAQREAERASPQAPRDAASLEAHGHDHSHHQRGHGHEHGHTHGHGHGHEH